MMANFIGYIKAFQKDRYFSVLAFLIFICPLAFSYYLYENYETPKYFFWLSLVGWAVAAYVGYSLKGVGKKTLALFSIWLIFGVLSTLMSADFITSVFGFYYRFTSSLLFYVSWTLFVLILAKSLNEERKKIIYQVLVFDAFLIALLGLLQSFGIFHYEGITATGLYRAPSFLGNPNFSSMFMAIVLPLAVRLAIAAKDLKRVIYYYSGVFTIIVSLLVLASRGSVIAAVLSLLFLATTLFFKKNNKKQFFKLFGIIILIGLIFFSVVSITRPEGFFQVFKSPDSNVVLRLKLWQTTLKGLERVPFFGEGPGNFQIFFEKTRGADFANEQGVFDDAHNLFLQQAATTGIPFALAFVSIVVYGVFRGIKRKEEDLDFSWKWAEISSILAFVIAVSFNPVTIPCFLSFGVVLAGLYSVRENNSEQAVVVNTQSRIRSVWFWVGLLFVYFGLALIISEFISAYGYRAYLKERYQTSRKVLTFAKYINPTYYLYDLYIIGSNIKLQVGEARIQDDIHKYLEKYGSGARAYVQGANLNYSMFRQTNNQIYVRKAVDTYQEALKRDPFFGERYGQIGIYYYILSDFLTARRYAELSLKLKPDHVPTLILLAKIYQVLGLNQEGLNALDTAYRLNPGNFQLRMWNYRAKYFHDINKVGVEVHIYEGELE